jgi:hypothetical protein
MDIIKDVPQAERETMSMDKKIYWINISISVMSTSFKAVYIIVRQIDHDLDKYKYLCYMSTSSNKVYIIVDKLIMTQIKINIHVMLTSPKVIFASTP